MRSGLTVLGMGERAVLVEAGPFDPPTLAELITLDLGERVEDVLPAATTVLVRLVEAVTPDIVDRIAELSATTVESARTVDGAVDIDVRYDGPRIVVAFNPEFVMAPLRNLDQDEIFIDLIDESSPGVIKIDEPFLYVIMPMRVAN